MNMTLEQPVLHKRVDELVLSARAFNCLKNANIVYVGDLVQKRESDLLLIPGFGSKSLNWVKGALAPMGLHLGMEVANE